MAIFDVQVFSQLATEELVYIRTHIDMSEKIVRNPYTYTYKPGYQKYENANFVVMPWEIS